MRTITVTLLTALAFSGTSVEARKHYNERTRYHDSRRYQDCRAEKRRAGHRGIAIGAVAGGAGTALLGGGLGGSLLGAAVGGTAGNFIGRGGTKC